MTGLRAAGRALLLALVRLLYRAPQNPPRRIDLTKIHKVLVVRIDPRVGNVLLTTPLVRALRRGLPKAKVDWLVADGKEPLVEGLADRILAFQKRDFFRAPWRFWRRVSSLRREGYDLVVEAGHWHAFSFTSLWLARATEAPVRIGHSRGPAQRFLTHPVERDPAIAREVPAKLELLRPLGIEAAGEELETTVDRTLEAKAVAQRAALEAGEGPMVAINPSARKRDHRWPPEAFGALAARLKSEIRAAPLVLWGPGEEEIAQAVVHASGGAARVAPPTDLAALAAVFRRSALVVTNDTGPMHLAVATGVPVVAVLLSADGSRWTHHGRFAGVPARGGSDEDVELVFQAAKALLTGNGA